MNAVMTVNFQGEKIYAAKDANGQPIVAVKPIVERFGLNWDAQMKRDDVLKHSTVIMTVETLAGMRETIGLPLKYIQGFLFGLSTGSIKDPEIKSRVIAYKEECYEALHEHFMGEGKTSFNDVSSLLNILKTVNSTARYLSKDAGKVAWELVGLPPFEVARHSANNEHVSVIQRFIKECTREDIGARVQASKLYEAYCDWCLQLEHRAANQRVFGDVCRELGLQKERGRVYVYLDISLNYTLKTIN